MLLFKPFVRYPFCNLYKVLGVTPQATQAEIKQKYYELAKKKHPDTGSISPEQFVKIQNAYQILKNPNSRQNYDREQFPEKYEQYEKDFTYYGDDRAHDKDPAKSWVSGLELFLNLGACLGIVYLIKLYLQPMTEHEIRRQNIILANQNIDDGPATQQKRRKQYLIQMKQKNFSANVVQLKVSNGSQQSTKAKILRKQSIQSIPGINKDSFNQQDHSKMEKYM